MFLLPDAEAWLVSYLAPLLGPGVHVGTHIPNPLVGKGVAVRRDGGPGTQVLDRPRFGIRVWAPTEEDATDLANVVRAHLAESVGAGPCRRYTELSGPSPVPDESGMALRYLTCQMTLRGSETTP